MELRDVLKGREVLMSETFGPVDGWFATVSAYRVKIHPHEGLGAADDAPIREPYEAVAHAHGAMLFGAGATPRDAIDDAVGLLRSFAGGICAAVFCE